MNKLRHFINVNELTVKEIHEIFKLMKMLKKQDITEWFLNY